MRLLFNHWTRRFSSFHFFDRRISSFDAAFENALKIKLSATVTVFSSLNPLFVAIFIFKMRTLFNTPWFQLFVVVTGLSSAVVTPAAGAGYVISARDRAQAAALSQQAYAAFQAGEYPQALDLLTQSDHLKPDQPDGWNLRGMVYLEEKVFDHAQAAFARAAALDPALWAAQFNLAEVSFQRKDYARARASFERLLSQTDRFKEKNKWELVQYKTCLCCLLLGDDQGAAKKLSKLPATGGATPAFLYAQAAVAFRGKNPAQAQKSLAAAQTAFPPALNDLFSDSLVQAGWEAPSVPLPALAANVLPPPPGSGTNAPLPGSGVHADVRIDPQLQADSAGPLPVADAPTRPVLAQITPALRNAPKTRNAPAVAGAAPAAPQPVAKTDLENSGLLLDE